MTVNRKMAAIGALVAAMAVIFIYASIDPSEASWMPRCSIKALTGYDCPGCGSQRALHALLHGDISAAWHYNAFIFFLIPAGLFYFVIEQWGRRDSRIYRTVTSPVFILIILFATILWWIARNIEL